LKYCDRPKQKCFIRLPCWLNFFLFLIEFLFCRKSYREPGHYSKYQLSCGLKFLCWLHFYSEKKKYFEKYFKILFLMLAINCYENQFEGNGFFAVQTIFKRKVRDSKLFYTTVLHTRLDKKAKSFLKSYFVS